jgi:hypothetical protein
VEFFPSGDILPIERRDGRGIEGGAALEGDASEHERSRLVDML